MLTSGKIKIEHYKCQRDKHNSTEKKIFNVQLDKENKSK